MIGLAAMLGSPAWAAESFHSSGKDPESDRVVAAILKSAPVDAAEPDELARPTRPMRLALSATRKRRSSPGIDVTSSAPTRSEPQQRVAAVREFQVSKKRGNFRKPPQKPESLGRETTYRVKPGDLLEISIWKEPDMRREMLVLPDGTISYPLAGHSQVVGMTPKEIEELLGRRLARYFKNPFINVIVKRTTGNQIYVLGEVRNPGAFTINQPVDVMQALSLAGGLSEFADKSEIIVLRRSPGGGQEVLSFKYSSVQRGRNLNANITLVSGDTVVVPERGLF